MRRRTKAVAVAMSLLAGVSMLGVGFAAWVIASDAKESASGNVTAETVTKAGVELAAKASGNISFTAPGNAISGWLTDDGAGTAENLTVTVTLTMTGANRVQYDWLIGDSADAEAEANGWASAVSYGFVSNEVEVNLSETDAEKYTLDTSSKTLAAKNGATMSEECTVILTFTFAWGAHFGGENPFAYYNKKGQHDTCEGGYINNGTFNAEPETDPTYDDDAEASLTELENLVNGLHYVFTFTGYSN